jgi:hypothetical protein
MVSTEGNDNRRDPRIDARNAITFSQLNKEEHYVGIAQDFSRSGMFFRSSKELKPGTCIVILPLYCHSTDLLWGDGECETVATSFCATTDTPGRKRKNFINMVTAQVTRCEFLDDAESLRYGVAVDYIRPTI